MKRFLGRLRALAGTTFLVIALLIGTTLAIAALAFAVIWLPLDFGEMLTVMAVWLAIGVLLGQNKPATMSITQYIGRRKRSYACCVGFFFVTLMVYVAVVERDVYGTITGKELWGLIVMPLVSFAVGFFAGQDKEKE